MEQEEKEILKETLELTKENNKMLKKVRGVQKFQAFWSILKILVIVGVAFGVFIYLEPYFEKVMKTFNEISGIKQDLDNSPIKDIFNKL